MLEAKLLQHIAGLCQAVLYTIFLDIHKVYGMMDRVHTLAVLEEYGVGPQVFRLLDRYWAQATMATR